MPDNDLDVLIVENIADLDAAARYIVDDLQPRLGAAIDTVCRSFVRHHNWHGASSWDQAETWFASPDWQIPSRSANGEFRCKVWLQPVPDDGTSEDQFWLTYLLGAGLQSMGLRWYRTDVRSKRVWRKELGLQRGLISSLRSRGFEYEEARGTFFLPVRIDPARLSTALTDEDPAAALEPLQKALDVLLSAKEEFDRLITDVNLTEKA